MPGFIGLHSDDGVREVRIGVLEVRVRYEDGSALAAGARVEHANGSAFAVAETFVAADQRPVVDEFRTALVFVRCQSAVVEFLRKRHAYRPGIRSLVRWDRLPEL